MKVVGRDSAVGIATRYWLDGRRSSPGGIETFGTHSDWSWGPLSLLYNGYLDSCPGVKRPGRGVNHPRPASTGVKERVEV